MDKSIIVEAGNSEEARTLGLKKLEKVVGRALKKEELSVELVEEKRGFLKFGKRSGTYKITTILKELTKEEEELLETTVENIGLNGSFKIKITDEGVMMKVIPPQGQGKAVHYQEVKMALESKEIAEVDWQIVQEIISESEGKWEKIAPRKPELDRDARAIIEISEDKLQAFLSYEPALGGQELTLAALQQLLQDEGIVQGIKEEKLKKIIKHREVVDRMLIAEGKPPQPGRDAELVYQFEHRTESVGTEREDGSINFYDLGLITNVQPGDVLVIKKDPKPGLPGKGVTGEELLPPEPRDRKLPVGKNVEAKDDNTLIAKIAGQVVLENEKIHILPVHEVNGDVNLSTGNIEFVGNVHVKGDVTEGFSIKAQGNVEIRGHVSVADIEAGGDVIIHKGYIGKHKSQIKAGGDVRIKFVENAIISAGKSIFITDAVMHSNLSAGDCIEVTKKKGLIVGGVTKARSTIEANIVGSTLATNTQLEVGIDPKLKLKVKELLGEVNDDKQNLQKTERALAILEKLNGQLNGLPQQKLVMYKQLQDTRKELERNIEEKQLELRYIEQKNNDANIGYVVVKKKVYPGVKIIIGNSQMNTHNEINTGTKFMEDEGEVRKYSLGW